MSAKQDRQGVRKPSDIERKYDLSGKDYTEIKNMATSAQNAADRAASAAESAVRAVGEMTTDVEDIDTRVSALEEGGGGASLETVYPVGSIYLSVLATNPATLFGFGTWEQIAQGRTLFGAGTLNNKEYVAGEEIEAGLPNIEGGYEWGTEDDDRVYLPGRAWSGAFSATNTTKQLYTGDFSEKQNKAADTMSFNASASNPIYGNSDTVQPPALVVYMWQRTA